MCAIQQVDLRDEASILLDLEENHLVVPVEKCEVSFNFLYSTAHLVNYTMSPRAVNKLQV